MIISKVDNQNVYDICCPDTDGYFRSLFYDISQILIASEVQHNEIGF